jgi:hypothetical protein
MTSQSHFKVFSALNFLLVVMQISLIKRFYLIDSPRTKLKNRSLFFRLFFFGAGEIVLTQHAEQERVDLLLGFNLNQ